MFAHLLNSLTCLIPLIGMLTFDDVETESDTQGADEVDHAVVESPEPRMKPRESEDGNSKT